MGQRVCLFLFRASAVLLLVAGLGFVGVFALWKELVSPEPGVWASSILEFLSRMAATWPAGGVIALALLWSIRPVSYATAGRDELGEAEVGGPASMMPVFLGLLALLALASSGPVVAWWKSGLALLEVLGIWEAVDAGERILSLLAAAAVLFVPVVGSATILSFLAGTATAALFRVGGRRFVRIYAAWMAIHAALVLTTVYSGDLFDDMAGPWLEEVRWEAANAESSDESVPPETLAYLEDWIPEAVARTSSLVTRATWISLVYAAWLPLLLFASGKRVGSPRRWRSGGRGAAGPG